MITTVTQYVPQRPGTVASAGLFRTSGNTPPALSAASITQFQNALNWLGHRTPITGQMPVASAATLRAFQDAYNRDPATIAQHYNPAPPIGVDGQWGPQTQTALSNAVSRMGGVVNHGETMTPLGGTAPRPGAPVAGKSPTATDAADAAVKGNILTSIANVPADPVVPATRPPPVGTAPVVAPVAGGTPAQRTESSFPVGPAIAVGAGVLALVGAIIWSSQKGASKPSPSRHVASRSRR